MYKMNCGMGRISRAGDGDVKNMGDGHSEDKGKETRSLGYELVGSLAWWPPEKSASSCLASHLFLLFIAPFVECHRIPFNLSQNLHSALDGPFLPFPTTSIQ